MWKLREPTDDDPELPEHDQGTTNSGRGHLCRVNRHGRVLRANSDTHDEASCEETLPRLRASGTDGSRSEANSRHEDFTTSTEIVVERIGDEGTAERECERRTEPLQSNQYLHQAGRQENDSVDDTDDPFVPAFAIDAEFLRVGQVCTIGPGLIPALSGGTNGAQAHRVPHHEGAVPFVVLLVLESGTLLVSELLDQLEPIRIPCHEGRPTEKLCILGHAMLLRPGFRVRDVLLGRNTLLTLHVRLLSSRMYNVPGHSNTPSADSRRGFWRPTCGGRPRRRPRAGRHGRSASQSESPHPRPTRSSQPSW